MLCDWFGDNKSKTILFGSKHKIKNPKPLNIHNNDIKIKQYPKVIDRILGKTLSREFMAIHVINKINCTLRFLYRQNRFLNVPVRRLLCNTTFL